MSDIKAPAVARRGSVISGGGGSEWTGTPEIASITSIHEIYDVYTPPRLEVAAVGADGRKVDPWEKAGECSRAIDATDDPKRREMLTHMRDLWINLADDHHLLSLPELAEQTTGLAQIHAVLIPSR
jgi:hypothetical protein